MSTVSFSPRSSNDVLLSALSPSTSPNFKEVQQLTTNDFSARAANPIQGAQQILPTSVAQVFQGTLTPSDLQDDYWFRLSQRSAVTLGLSGLSANATLLLLDSTGSNPIATSSNPGNLAETINTLLSPGIYYIRVIGVGTDVDTSYRLSARADANAQTDLLWRNQRTGEMMIWQMDGLRVVDRPAFAAPKGLEWRLADTADFNGDGSADLLWQNDGTGESAITLMNGTAPLSEVSQPAVSDRQWQIVDTADFNGDGSPDIFWRNQQSGKHLIWLMSGAQFGQSIEFAPMDNLSWQPKATGDFTSDGKPDVLWQNTRTGEAVVWQMNGSQRTGLATLRAGVDPLWEVEGTGDFNRDGKTDVFLRHRGSGENQVWLLDGSRYVSQETIEPLSDTVWQAVAPFTRFQEPTTADLAGNTVATALDLGVLNGTGTYRDRVNSSDRVDMYRFQLANAANISVALREMTGNGDLLLYRDGNNNGVLEASEQVGRSRFLEQRDEAINLAQMAPGTYFIQIVQEDTSNIGYTLHLSSRSPSNLLPVEVDLATLSGTRTFNGAINGGNTSDIYRLNLPQANNLDITLSGLSADADVRLIRDANSNGLADFDEEIARSERSGSATDSLNLAALAGGTYLVQVYQAIGNTAYTLTLTSTAQPLDGAGNTLATARDIGVLTSAQTFNDYVGIADTNDFYRFTLNQISNFSLELANLSADADVQLVQDRNNNGIIESSELIAVSQRPSTQTETINTALAAGTYFIRVLRYDGNTFYRLTVSTAQFNLPAGYSTTYGYGLVNAASAVARSLNQVPFAAVPNLGGDDWNLDNINAPEVWARGYTGSGVTVAVVDSGVDITHPDLDGNIWINSDEIAGNGIDDDRNGFVDDTRGWDFVNSDNTPADGDGHGTHVAGSIGAERNGFGATGVAYGATLMPVRVLDNAGFGSWSAIAAGIRYAADNGARIINLSLGGTYASVVEDAIRYATDRGAFVVMAAGNDGGLSPDFPANLAAQRGVAVGAVNRNNQMASFSNLAGTAPTAYVVAPGVDIYSTTPNNTYSNLSGTSMATPQVAGIAALMLSANPTLTPAQLRSLLLETANPSGITV